jgi:DNA integrity scanning protein DisA with diadenylate cyclase activity
LLSIATARARARSGDVYGALGWDDYTSSRDPEGARLDEAIHELTHQIAGLAAVDGAVLMTSGFEILGFGAEITGRLPEVSSVRDALDVEGQRWVLEATEQLGTRHRSAYRFAAAVQDALAIVVSQDGGVRFATRRDQEVMSWHYLASGFDA